MHPEHLPISPWKTRGQILRTQNWKQLVDSLNNTQTSCADVSHMEESPESMGRFCVCIREKKIPHYDTIEIIGNREAVWKSTFFSVHIFLYILLFCPFLVQYNINPFKSIFYCILFYFAVISSSQERSWQEKISIKEKIRGSSGVKFIQ